MCSCKAHWLKAQQVTTSAAQHETLSLREIFSISYADILTDNYLLLCQTASDCGSTYTASVEVIKKLSENPSCIPANSEKNKMLMVNNPGEHKKCEQKKMLNFFWLIFFHVLPFLSCNYLCEWTCCENVEPEILQRKNVVCLH